ncbi:MAG: 50S ribosomal protein L9 [Acidiferrobacterales bacterium]|nr:50S ribosomal protein L9 [Acidiferrobacterales bacterium]
MQVILLEKIVNLGNLGDLVTVKPGYARNYLVPQGLATVATKENIEKFEGRRLELEKASADKLQAAKARASELDGQSVEIASRASDEGKLFGSVGLVEISEAFAAKGLELNKSEIQLPDGPIKVIGSNEVTCSVHSEVSFTIAVEVVPE